MWVVQVSLLLAFFVDRFGGSFEASQPAMERVALERAALARQRGEEKLIRRRSGGGMRAGMMGGDFERARESRRVFLVARSLE